MNENHGPPQKYSLFCRALAFQAAPLPHCGHACVLRLYEPARRLVLLKNHRARYSPALCERPQNFASGFPFPPQHVPRCLGIPYSYPRSALSATNSGPRLVPAFPPLITRRRIVLPSCIHAHEDALPFTRHGSFRVDAQDRKPPVALLPMPSRTFKNSVPPFPCKRSSNTKPPPHGSEAAGCRKTERRAQEGEAKALSRSPFLPGGECGACFPEQKSLPARFRTRKSAEFQQYSRGGRNCRRGRCSFLPGMVRRRFCLHGQQYHPSWRPLLRAAASARPRFAAGVRSGRISAPTRRPAGSPGFQTWPVPCWPCPRSRAPPA